MKNFFIYDITSDTTVGNVTNAQVIELDNGNLVAANQTVVQLSTDSGNSWITKYSWANQVQWNARLAYKAKNGNLFFGAISRVNTGQIPGDLIRSIDGGNSWTVVVTSDGSGWWHMCEDSSGNLYASEYSGGNQDSVELYAYNIWKSNDHGATWSIFHAEPPQSSPGAKDGIRHIHLVAIDNADQLYCAFGEGGWGPDGGMTYQLNSDGTLGNKVATLSTTYNSPGSFNINSTNRTRNGMVAFVQAANGNIIFASDNSAANTGGAWGYLYNKGTNDVAQILDLCQSPSFVWTGSFTSDALIGNDGVLYLVTTGDRVNSLSYVLASTDNGITWKILKYRTDIAHGTTGATCNINGPSHRIYINTDTNGSYVSIPDYTKVQLSHRRALVTSQ